MHGSAMQYYGQLRFSMGTRDFWTRASTKQACARRDDHDNDTVWRGSKNLMFPKESGVVRNTALHYRAYCDTVTHAHRAFQQFTSLSQFFAPLFFHLVFNKVACAID
jgi:hypothetical protein